LNCVVSQSVLLLKVTCRICYTIITITTTTTITITVTIITLSGTQTPWPYRSQFCYMKNMKYPAYRHFSGKDLEARLSGPPAKIVKRKTRPAFIRYHRYEKKKSAVSILECLVPYGVWILISGSSFATTKLEYCKPVTHLCTNTST
jgi:hypothetical protein